MAYQPIYIGQDGDPKEPLSNSLEKIKLNILDLYNSNPGTITWSALSNSIVPATDNTYDLGSPTKQWASLYVSSNTIYIGGTSVGIDEGGNLTIGGDPVATTIDYNDIVNIPDLSVYATTTSVSTAISDLVNGAGPALDTLKELADALGGDASFASTVTNSIATKAPISNATFTGVTTVPALTESLLQGLLANNDVVNLTASSPRILAFNPVGTNASVYLPDDEVGVRFTFINPSYSGNPFTVRGVLSSFVVAPGETKSFLNNGVDWDLATTNSTTQSLSFTGTDLTISGGNTVNLASLSQTLTLVGTDLTISGGNTVDLSTIVGDTVGNFILAASTITTDDSSDITITPNVIMSNNLTVENDLTVNGNIVTVSTGTPEVYSETEILLTAGTNKTWTFGTDGSLTFPDSSIQTGAAISIADLKTLVAASTDFADFQSRIAAL